MAPIERRAMRLLTALLLLAFPGAVSADWNTITLREARRCAPRGSVAIPYGITPSNTRIYCFADPEVLTSASPKQPLLVVGSFSGRIDEPTWTSFLAGWQRDSSPFPRRESYALVTIPIPDPDHFMLARLLALWPGQSLWWSEPRSFPPGGTYYEQTDHVADQYLWRWLSVLGPQVVLHLEKDARAFQLARSLERLPAGHPVRVRAFSRANLSDAAGWARYLKSEEEQKILSNPHRELLHRGKRSPLEVAQLLTKHYGHDLNEASYIPALALVGRLRVGELTGDESHRADVLKIVEPYRNGKKPSLGSNPNGSITAGHLVFAELARGKDHAEDFKKLLLQAAAQGWDAEGNMRPVMPAHNEMSDAVFMGTPILIEAGVLTGEAKYFQMAERHLAYMQKLGIRRDGLYRHSPLDETAWGRGNGFPALGLAWCLDRLPADHELRPFILKSFQDHIAALAMHQDELGMWHQVVDEPGSYRELTATCMISWAMLRGVRNGWLDEAEYRPRIELAWQSLNRRIADDGALTDVCTGTGKQQSYRDYLNRTALFGPDARGGAMALLFTTELADWQREKEGRGK